MSHSNFDPAPLENAEVAAFVDFFCAAPADILRVGFREMYLRQNYLSPLTA